MRLFYVGLACVAAGCVTKYRRFLSVCDAGYVGHVVWNRWRVLSLAWHKWFSCEGRERKIYRCGRALSSEPQISNFLVVIWQTTSKIALKSVPHVQHDYFSLFNQSNHWFVALSLPFTSSFLKLCNKSIQKCGAVTMTLDDVVVMSPWWSLEINARFLFPWRTKMPVILTAKRNKKN